MKHLSTDQLVNLIEKLTEEIKTLVDPSMVDRSKYYRQQLSLELASRY